MARGWNQVIWNRVTAFVAVLALAACSGVADSPAATNSQNQGPANLAAISPVVTCASLTGTDMTAIGGPGSKITQASETTSDGIGVCSVRGTLAPAVNFQVLLPLKTWTQRYLQVGCGGLCGAITLRSGASEGCKVLNDGGFVMAATDMGHTMAESDGAWALDPVRRADFAYRAQHLTSQASKALIRAFYGQEVRYSYFNGCSDGGREGLMEAQRFPDDFDGVIAGAPAMLFTVQNTLYHGWMARSNLDAAGHPILLADRLPILHKAVVATCDRTDGVVDGLISLPAACRFDMASVTCPAGTTDTSACLTAAEADVARKFYEGPRDPETHAFLTAGQPLYGSELEWPGVFVPGGPQGRMMSQMVVPPVMRYLAFPEPRPDATLESLEFTRATLDDLRDHHRLFDATNPDLSAFAAKGHKLIMWHGLSDQHIAPANTVSYQKALFSTMGKRVVGQFERLYMLPGVGHCGGGEGPSSIDLLTPMMTWVESGHAPEAIMSGTTRHRSTFGQPVGMASTAPSEPARPEMLRPVYPWPAVASHTGSGSYTDPASWTRSASTQVVLTHNWSGADLFGPYTFINQ
ncbi:feruloyl esterase [Novosphingobium sp. PhB165]|uniref:tannase/feruloyl esterase family alpha/beta hydrolase n=1 Tax=Novosphingobium sp. PhB165 TaxID=2485105 RepID=UPI00104EEDEA|nr:tannase/feruloyl esterase family alpha/beta hydrolase [Novosphingobium sp. PhB165]TCM19768.1 feruloyl esterase [Novosphingobium sp. PhB165]